MKPTKLELLISDVDGTLVRPDKTLSDETIAAVQRLKKAGIPMSIISARPPSGLHWIADSLDLPGPFGAFNGGTLFLRGGKVIERHCLPTETAQIALKLLTDAKVTVWVFADGLWCASTDQDPYTGHEVKSARIDPTVTTDFSPWIDRIDKVVGVSDDPQLLIDLEKQAIAQFGGSATIARSQVYYLDFTATAANKGDGVTFLADAFHVDIERVAVIGDQANDLPMFERAGYSVAMGQGPAEVRAQATAQTASNADNGVAQAIDSLIIPRA